MATISGSPVLRYNGDCWEMRVASLLAGRGLTLSAFILKNGFSMQRSRHSFNEP